LFHEAENLSKIKENRTLLDLSYSLEKALKLKELYVFKNKNTTMYQKLLDEKIDFYGYVILILGVIYTICLGQGSFILLIILPFSDGINIGICFLISIVGLFTGMLIMDSCNKLGRNIAKAVLKRKSNRKTRKLDALLDNNDFQDKLIEESLDTVFEAEYLEKTIFAIFSEISTEIAFRESDEIKKDQIKRLVFSIISGNFVLESLELDKLVNKEEIKMKNSLLEILEGIDFVIKEFSHKIELKQFKNDFKTIKKNLNNILEIIQLLVEINQSKDYTVQFDKLSTIIKEQIKEQPMAKSRIKISTLAFESGKDVTLSSITAIDSRVIEIRTKAGTFYTLADHFRKEDLEFIREFELLTDQELVLKIEVIESTLNLLEKDKTLSAKDKKQLKENYLKKLLTAEQTLKKRKSVSKTIVCSYCKNETSLIKRACSQCGADLPLCMICLNAIGVNEKIKVCPHCKNIAHADHFDAWLEKSNHCPVCKKKIKKNPKEITLTDKIIQKL
jgi:hypothetical protein